jgi:hypothetical protein
VLKDYFGRKHQRCARPRHGNTPKAAPARWKTLVRTRREDQPYDPQAEEGEATVPTGAHGVAPASWDRASPPRGSATRSAPRPSPMTHLRYQQAQPKRFPANGTIALQRPPPTSPPPRPTPTRRRHQPSRPRQHPVLHGAHAGAGNTRGHAARRVSRRQRKTTGYGRRAR